VDTAETNGVKNGQVDVEDEDEGDNEIASPVVGLHRTVKRTGMFLG
jgi:hypothetical protein